MASHSASNMSHTPAGHYQMNARHNASNQTDYILESMGENRRESPRVRASGESQEGLTKVHQHTLIAKIDVDQLV